jgi:hypothetical protein
MTISLVLLFIGSLVATFHAGQYSARLECDNRYAMHINKLMTNGDREFAIYFNATPPDYYFNTNFLTFKPSGRLYSGSSESGFYIISGGAIALFGLAGLFDTFRRRKA